LTDGQRRVASQQADILQGRTARQAVIGAAPDVIRVAIDT
jgi:hypothetical protein